MSVHFPPTRRGLRDGIEARRPERSATGKATRGEPQRSCDRVRLECFERVGRTGRIETTRRRTALADRLVPVNRTKTDAFQHGGIRGRAASARRDTAWRRASNVKSWADGRAPIKYVPRGRPGSSWRSASRSRRRIRLRWTAPPNCLPIANATRGGSASSASTLAHNAPEFTRRPCSRNAWNVARSETRAIRLIAADGPSDDATSVRRDLRGCSCAHENRASWRGGDCWVERCASPCLLCCARSHDHTG
jgi:hypothetical protein